MRYIRVRGGCFFQSDLVLFILLKRRNSIVLKKKETQCVIAVLMHCDAVAFLCCYIPLYDFYGLRIIMLHWGAALLLMAKSW